MRLNLHKSLRRAHLEMTTPTTMQEPYWRRIASIIREVVPMALFSVGGRGSHVGLMHDRFVVVNKWLSDDRYLEILSIASAAPGPAAGQIVTAVGLFRGGPLGAAVGLVFWMLPGFIMQTLAGVGAQTYLQNGLPAWLASLAPAAVSLVVTAAVRLWQKAVGDNLLRSIVASVSACVVVAVEGQSSLVFPSVMATGGLLILGGHLTGFAHVHIEDDAKSSTSQQDHTDNPGLSPRRGVLILIVWFIVLIALAIFRPQDSPNHTMVTMFFALYWIGAVVFGGAQVLFQVLLQYFVNLGWMTKEQFLLGFALIQSLPGPMFNIAAYLGAVLFGPVGALVATVGLTTPGIALFLGLIPVWEHVRTNRNLKVFLLGVNAAACGVIVASIFQLWEKAVHSNADATIALATGISVGVFNLPSPVAITLGTLLGYLLSPGLLNIGQTKFCAV